MINEYLFIFEMPDGSYKYVEGHGYSVSVIRIINEFIKEHPGSKCVNVAFLGP